MSRGALDGKRESNQADKLKADSNKPSGERPTEKERQRECAREERLEGTRERETAGVRAEGKDQWEAAAVLAGGGDEN